MLRKKKNRSELPGPAAAPPEPAAEQPEPKNEAAKRKAVIQQMGETNPKLLADLLRDILNKN